jgi:CheY-like chemotaxis protein
VVRKKLNCILLVDDDPDDILYHRIIIEEAGCAEKVDDVHNGVEALSYLKKTGQLTPELIFLDINMPRMNGWEFLDHYKQLDETQKSRIVILMLTTSVNPSDLRKAQEIKEISGFETKPLTKETLEQLLEDHFADFLK